MLIREIINEMTSAGAIATVAMPMTKKPIKRPGVGAKKKDAKINIGKGIYEGEERSIIRDAAVDYLLDEFGGDNWKLYADNKEELEQKIYSELSILSVDEIIDPNMEVGGQRIGNFASGRVIDVVSSGEVIDDVMSQMNIDEGKSPHKKGTKKYKKHMAAMHAGG